MARSSPSAGVSGTPTPYNEAMVRLIKAREALRGR